MPRKLTVSQFESDLIGLMGVISSCASSGELNILLDGAYPDTYANLDAVRNQLVKIEMYDNVKTAIQQSESLVRAQKYEEADELLLSTSRALMKASGTWDRISARYSKKKDT